ncbi:MAG TPA: phosphomannose isomerase type II C-terminal cupin domain [Nocardioidaceae bacterium]|nr:phosphomannose isomerase type II C-terminal cupin domain [Nocardioidaceae bacterium]
MSLEWEARPWGSWHILDEDKGYKVKRIHVNPGARLSYQSHEHRSEHWVVLVGHATAIINDVEHLAGPGESVNVPLGAKHRLINNGEVELVIIEVQRGEYTGEDDIKRYEDDYGRTPSQ